MFALCCLLLAVLIPPVIRVHGDTTTNQPILEPGDPTADEIKQRLRILIITTYSLTVSFAVISLVALGFFKKFVQKEQSTAEADGEDSAFNKLATNYSAPITTTARE
jgi:hypothetical protein